MTKPFAYEGSISYGTLRPRDLISAFSHALEDLNPMEAKGIRQDHKAVYRVLDAGLWDFVEEATLNDDRWPGVETGRWRRTWLEKSDSCLEALQDALEAQTPDGYYFGAHEGDGADFGFWPVEPTEW